MIFKIFDAETGKLLEERRPFEVETPITTGESITIYDESGKSSPRKVKKVSEEPKETIRVWHVWV